MELFNFQTSRLVFTCLQYKSLKTLWEKKKLLVTSNFSFSHGVFYLFAEVSVIFIKFKVFVCSLFQFGRVLNLSFWKGLNSLPNNKILHWSKLKIFIDDFIDVNKKFKFGLGRVKNIVGKGENAGYQHFLLFSTMLFKGLFFRVVKNQDCVVIS